MVSEEMRQAAEKTGVTLSTLYRVMKSRPDRSALWCGYFAASKSFACNPGFTDKDSFNYANTMISSD